MTDMKKKGFALIEVTIAMVLLAMVVVGLFQGLTIGIMGTYRDTQLNTAMHLAQSQMEYIKLQDFNDAINTTLSCSFDEPPCNCSLYPIVPDIDMPAGFDCADIQIEVIPDPSGYGVNGLQKITVTVSYESDSVVLEGYKTRR